MWYTSLIFIIDRTNMNVYTDPYNWLTNIAYFTPTHPHFRIVLSSYKDHLWHLFPYFFKLLERFEFYVIADCKHAWRWTLKQGRNGDRVVLSISCLLYIPKSTLPIPSFWTKDNCHASSRVQLYVWQYCVLRSSVSVKFSVLS